MQELIQNIIISIIQGLTEFLPVSSSGHLAIFQNIIGNVNVSLDAFLHLATLLAVIVYFFKDILLILKDFFTLKTESENFKLAIYLIIATIPAGIVGYLFRETIESLFSNLFFISIGFIITGLFLFTASLKPSTNKQPTLKNTFIIGLSQALALIPGISRSGSTTSTGILLGLSKQNAIRFSFLLSIPAILGAVILNFSDISFSANLIIPFVLTFLIGLFSIYLFMNIIKTRNLKYFAYYCWLLAIIILGVIIL
jgi:undecaprenyl-diphosphatase